MACGLSKESIYKEPHCSTQQKTCFVMGNFRISVFENGPSDFNKFNFLFLEVLFSKKSVWIFDTVCSHVFHFFYIFKYLEQFHSLVRLFYSLYL